MIDCRDAIGQYRIERMLGRRDGVVLYRARDDTARAVLLRVARRSELGDEMFASYPGLFARHAELARRLPAQYVAPVYGIGQTESVAYIASELIEATDLETRLKSGPLDWRKALSIGEGGAAALELLHGEQFVHRDIKPRNLLVDAAGGVRLADLSLALDVSASSKDEAASLIGTPAYMSPEQITGSARLDGRSDVFSLGVVVYELLTGAQPFTGPGALSITKSILRAEPQPPSTLNATVPSACDAVVLKALAKNPDQRYASAAAFGAAMSAALAEADRTGPSAEGA